MHYIICCFYSVIQNIHISFFRTKSQQDYYTQPGDSETELMSISVATHYWEI